MLGFPGLGRLALGEDAALVGGHHVLDVNEGIGASAVLQQLQGVLDDVADAAVSIGIDTLSQIHVDVLVKIAHGQQLAIEGHQGLTHTGTCGLHQN